MHIPNFKGEIRKNEPLSKHTSFAIGGPADVFAYPVDCEDLKLLLHAIREQKLSYFILGSGTNLLVRDNGFRGVVISLKRMNKVSLEREYRSIGGSFQVVYAEAGAPLAKVLSLAVEEGLTGFEFSAGIPGTIGGAIRMNAGTALGELGDVIETVSMLSPDGVVTSRSRDDMGFGYRTSSIAEGNVVIDVRVALRRDDKEKVSTRVLELLTTRKQRQPYGLPNAGSMFKNPNEAPAGKLIESAGLKGKTVGSAMVSDQHANFITTLGKAKAADVLALMEIVQQTVLDVHGVRLEPEVKIIGED